MNIILPVLTAIFLVAIRIGTILFFVPIPPIRQLPLQARFFIVFTLSILLVNYLSLSVSLSDETSLIATAITEFCNGLFLSLPLHIAFAVFQIAGQLIDAQLGFNTIAILNPNDHSHDPLLTRLLTMVATACFLAFDAHHEIIHGLIDSFIQAPLGEIVFLQSMPAIFKQLSSSFSIAFMFAGPIIFGLLLIDLCAAVLTRNMPQISSYFLSLPVKVLLGLFLLILVIKAVAPVMHYLLQQSIYFWQKE